MAGRSPRGVDDLETLAQARFGGLGQAELTMLRAAPRGELAYCGPRKREGDPANDPANADRWGPERQIRAELIRWLCVDREAVRFVDPRGVLVHAAKVAGALHLSFASVPFPLGLFRSRLSEAALLISLQIPSLDFSGSRVRSITADRANVKGSVFLREGFSAEGEVRLLGAQIGGDLACTGGTFANLVAETAAIKGNLFWQGIKGAGTATLCLMNASVGAIADDEASWTAPGKLFLDGFVYERISAGLKDARKRLEWLARQEPFSLPPYRQLAKVLREAGDARGAREVLFQMERRRRQGEDRSRVARLWSWLLRWIIGYGLKPVRAVGWLVLLTVAGFAVFGLGYLSGTVTPTEKEAYKFFQTHGQPPLHYPRFNALVYSFEHSLPFVNLGQKDHWGPNPQGSVREPALEWRLFARLRDTQVRGVRPFRFPWPGLLHAIFWSQILQDGCSPRFSWPG